MVLHPPQASEKLNPRNFPGLKLSICADGDHSGQQYRKAGENINSSVLKGFTGGERKCRTVHGEVEAKDEQLLSE